MLQFRNCDKATCSWNRCLKTKYVSQRMWVGSCGLDLSGSG